MTRLVGVLGSVTPPGRLHAALDFALSTAAQGTPGVETALIDLGDHQIGFADGRPLEQLTDDTPALVRAVADADAVLFASPVYRGSYTGALKNFLDLLPVEALLGKPCGIIAMGATQHHYLGVDWHLRDVLTWFGAFLAPSSVYLASSDFQDGALIDTAKEDLRALVSALLRLLSVAQQSETPLGPTPLAARRR
jgi:FMN reductase